MEPNSNFVALNQETIQYEWIDVAWKRTPSKVIVAPNGDLVLFGADSQDNEQRVAFVFEAKDAESIGKRLVNAARNAGDKQ